MSPWSHWWDERSCETRKLIPNIEAVGRRIIVSLESVSAFMRRRRPIHCCETWIVSWNYVVLGSQSWFCTHDGRRSSCQRILADLDELRCDVYWIICIKPNPVVCIRFWTNDGTLRQNSSVILPCFRCLLDLEETYRCSVKALICSGGRVVFYPEEWDVCSRNTLCASLDRGKETAVCSEIYYSQTRLRDQSTHQSKVSSMREKHQTWPKE
jgi:hypothetical protein